VRHSPHARLPLIAAFADLRMLPQVKEGVVGSGMVGYRFNTIGVSDGISMGTDGMSFSLQSRDLIADSIETVMGGQWYDANIAIPGCDKNMPGCLIAMGRLNRPALMVSVSSEESHIPEACAGVCARADIVTFATAVSAILMLHRLSWHPCWQVYGGTIRAGCTKEYPQLDIVSAFQVTLACVSLLLFYSVQITLLTRNGAAVVQ
jgi:Dehydratase family